MTDFLIKHFISDSENTDDPVVREQYGVLGGVLGVICNSILFIIKIIVGVAIGSIAVISDAFNNLSDLGSSLVSIIGARMGGKRADKEHPYGHGRYEYLSGLMVAVLIMVIGVELFKSSLDKVLHPSAVEFSWVTVGVLAFSILLKTWMALFNTKTGKMINSNTLIATAADSRNDVITTGAVLVAAILSHFVGFELDGWMGLGVAVFILYSGFGLVKDTLDPMLGKAPEDEQVEEIRQKILSYPGVLGTHDLMVHDYGPGRQFASVHVEMAAEGDAMKNHDVIDNIERDFMNDEGLHMIVHFDPISTKDNTVNELRIWIGEKVKEIDERLTIHDLRIVYGITHTNVIFDCVVPHNMDMTDKEVKKAINDMVKEKYPTYYCVITIDKSYAAMPH